MLQLALDTIIRPRDAADRLLQLNLSEKTLFQAALLMACLQAILPMFGLIIDRFGNTALVQFVATYPFAMAAKYLATIYAAALLLHRIGASFGGKGSARQMMLLSVWYATIGVCILIPVAVVFYLNSTAGTFLMAAAALRILFAFSLFVQKAHQFQSLFLTFVGIIVGQFLVETISTVILTGLGFPQQAGV